MPGTPTRLSAGQQNRRITIEHLAETVGVSSFPLEVWTPLVTGLHATFEDQSGGEAFSADQVSATAAATWTIHYRADCDPELLDVAKIRRVVANGRVYDIVAANQIGLRRGLALQTRAKVG